jgi:hypothetical protein
MTKRHITACIALLLITSLNSSLAQPYQVNDEYLILNAYTQDPLYTTYAAAMERSLFYGDKGYKMTYDDDYRPVTYGSEFGGDFFLIWEINGVVVNKISDFHSKPIVRASFSDMALLEYQPWPGIAVEELFFVYSSQLAVVDCQITNQSNETIFLDLFPVFAGADSLQITGFSEDDNAYSLSHFETKKRLISNLGDKYPYPTHYRDLFSASFQGFSHGGYPGGMKEFYNIIKTDFYAEDRSDSLNLAEKGYVDFVSLHGKVSLQPGERKRIRYIRGIQAAEDQSDELMADVRYLKTASLQPFVDNNIRLFSRIPRLEFDDPKHKMVYLSAFNLARGCMLPPSGETAYNFYVFSREPLWGWGHGHQVLHESLSMLTYAYLYPVSAQNSQRVYMEQQGEDGLIAYRHGPRGAQTYPHKGEPTTSAPFYSWINWEIYQVSQDREFLEDAYVSGVKYLEWLKKHRDTDEDGTYEWGPYGIIENVRDWYNAVFQVSAERYLDVDKEDISDELECLDLSLMVRKQESQEWQRQYDDLSRLINERMWDENSAFYYSVNKQDHSFYFMTRDLKRQEIIGFLPLWARVANEERASLLVETLTDTTRFWRKYGVPTLSAQDDWYSPYVDYCCKWNGPVWLLWDYMVLRGLRNYGYDELSLELGKKMIDAVQVQLSRNHNFWESYSPDNEVLNCPPNYIWDAIIARVMIEMERE